MAAPTHTGTASRQRIDPRRWKSQVLQIVAAVSGSAASLQDARIHFGVAAWVTAFELAGVIAGTWLAHSVSSVTLRRIAAWLCIAVAALMAVRAW